MSEDKQAKLRIIDLNKLEEKANRIDTSKNPPLWQTFDKGYKQAILDLTESLSSSESTREIVNGVFYQGMKYEAGESFNRSEYINNLIKE